MSDFGDLAESHQTSPTFFQSWLLLICRECGHWVPYGHRNGRASEYLRVKKVNFAGTPTVTGVEAALLTLKSQS